MARLAIVTSHPIQYHAPWFSALAKQPGLDLDVLYCHYATPKEQAQAGFGVEFDWDQSLLDGYSHRFLKNVAKEPSVATFSGLDTPELAALLPSYDAVLVSGWHYKSAWQAMRTCWRNDIPVMARGDSHLHTQRSMVKRWAKEVPYRWFIPKLDACLPVGKWSRDYFLHYGAVPDRVWPVPHTTRHIGDGEYTAMQARRLGYRQTLGLTEDAVVFSFAGKFIGKKNPLDFVLALAQAHHSNTKIAGLMVGDGPLRGDCENLIRKTNAPVRLAGFLNQSEINRAYVASDALVLPSDGGETWGLVVNEAMNCRRPCLVSDQVGCGPDLILEGKTGHRFKVGDIKDLAMQMVECASDTGRLKSMGDSAHQHIAQFDISAAVNGTMAALARVQKN